MRCVYVEDIAFQAGKRWAEKLAQTMERDFVVMPSSAYSADEEADLVFFAVPCNARRVQHFLNMARGLRSPYIFLTPAMRKIPQLLYAPQPINSILAPVSMLEEEVHKAEIISHLARFTQAEITLLTAGDYGSRARTNTDKILTFLHAREQALGTTFSIQNPTARFNSLNLHKELFSYTPDVFVVTASRDYGLDDLIFGPPERKLILRTPSPVVLINPRGDLYSLCD